MLSAPVLHYQAPQGCADGAIMRARLVARSPTVDATTRRIDISIELIDEDYVGTLRLDEDPRAYREIRGARCQDVVDALALIAALALDLEMLDAPDEPPPASAMRPAATVAGGVQSGPPRAARWRAQATAAGQVAGGVSPGAMYALAIGARLERVGVARVALTAWLGRDNTSSNMGEVSFRWTAARAGLCLNPTIEDLGLEVCADLEAGVRSVAAPDAVRSAPARRLWLAAGAHAGFEWPESSRSFGQLQVGLATALVRDRFYLTPNETLHATPPIIPWLLLGAGIRFP
ncbi:MAG: hypothetical protein R3B48_03865 [Kofleriaceae bacterium]